MRLLSGETRVLRIKARSNSKHSIGSVHQSTGKPCEPDDSGLDPLLRDRGETEPEEAPPGCLIAEEYIARLDHDALLEGRRSELSRIEPLEATQPEARTTFASSRLELRHMAIECRRQRLGASFEHMHHPVQEGVVVPERQKESRGALIVRR